MWNEFMDIVGLLLSYPTVIPFAGLVISIGILFVSMVTIGFDSHMELPTEIAGFDNPLVTAGLSKVPLFIGLSVTFLPMTIFTAIIDFYLLKSLGAALIPLGILGDVLFYIITIVLLLALFIGSLYIAGYICKPLEKALQKTKLNINFIGLEASVSSVKLDKEYGEIRFMIGHREYILTAVVDDDNIYHTGDKLVIHSKIPDKDRYLVVSNKKMLDKI